MKAGRPLRFLTVLLAGWGMARGVTVYGDGVDAAQTVNSFERIAAALAPPAAAAAAPSRGFPILLPVRRSSMVGPVRPSSARVRVASDSRATVVTAEPQAAAATPIADRREAHEASPSPSVSFSPAIVPPPIPRTGSRLAGSAWLIARNGSADTVATSQLGASQAGIRMTYAIGSDRRLALSARLSAPLSGRGREAAVGIDWQPTRAPIHVIAEQRMTLDGGRGGPTLSVVGGFGPSPIARGVRLEGYGQAGVIARDGGEGFAEGALRASHPLGAGIDIGAGAWGGAQRGASRLDIGPSLAITIPVARHALRLTADWRERIAGASRPGSGPAVSIGTNF